MDGSKSGRRVWLFVPCYVNGFYPAPAISAVGILERNGYEVRLLEGVPCCGQPLRTLGRVEEARAVAHNVEAACIGKDPVVVLSSSCTAFLKHHQKAAVLDFADFLVQNQIALVPKLTGRVGLQEGCHGRTELRSRAAKTLLGRLEGLELVEIDEACCGFGGAFAAQFSEVSVAIGQTMVERCAREGVKTLICTDAGCLLHLNEVIGRLGAALKAVHYLEVIS